MIEHLQKNRIYDEDYLRQLVVYIHLNPVKHKFTNDFESYKHSSYRTYLSEKQTNIIRAYILELFCGLENFIFYHDENRIKHEGIIKEINNLDE
ncbi:hypothetical protein [Flavobacterium sp.]|uniref:hypothetical protein n=1 Tax=Flavobacterium sp. TaxID=239 RepID=UPI003751AE7C